MSKIILSFIFTFITSIPALAATRTEEYSSTARNKNGELTYKEQHKVLFNDQKVLTANTMYLDASGKVIGEMSSDFTKMITTPDYEYKDLRSGISHGIKIDGENIKLWHKNKTGQLAETTFFKNQFAKEALIVGCQGLHYYLIDNLDLVKEKKTIPIVYFMPGKLDYYKFTLKLDREDSDFIYLKLSIDSFILKLFTSSLDLKYRKSDRRLIQFSGLSNITDDKDQLQKVVIDYNYN